MSDIPGTHDYPIEGHVCRGRPPELPATEPWRCHEGPLDGNGDVWLIHPGVPKNPEG